MRARHTLQFLREIERGVERGVERRSIPYRTTFLVPSSKLLGFDARTNERGCSIRVI
ncbi:hypothetical protein [Phyllobacterium sp. K27]